MSSSMIATIYLIALVVFFILLVVLTIAWIAGKAGNADDMYDDDDDDYEEYDSDGEDEEINPEPMTESISESEEDMEEENNPEPMTESISESEEDMEEENNPEPVTESVSESEEDMDEEVNPESITELEENIDENAETEPELEPTEEVEDVEKQDEIPITDEFIDSAFAPQPVETGLTNEEINQSVREAVALGEAVAGMGTGFSASAMFGVSEEFEKGNRRHHKASVVPSTDDFFWFNKMDVAERPSYKTPEMYYHYFDTAKDCIEDLLIEMYDCALVRTEEIRYIAYGIEPRAISMREILSSGNYLNQQKLKEPTTQDLVRIYEKWCGYVEKLFDKVEIHADEYTLNEIKRILCEYGRNDVDVLLEGK